MQVVRMHCTAQWLPEDLEFYDIGTMYDWTVGDVLRTSLPNWVSKAINSIDAKGRRYRRITPCEIMVISQRVQSIVNGPDIWIDIALDDSSLIPMRRTLIRNEVKVKALNYLGRLTNGSADWKPPSIGIEVSLTSSSGLIINPAGETTHIWGDSTTLPGEF